MQTCTTYDEYFQPLCDEVREEPLGHLLLRHPVEAVVLLALLHRGGGDVHWTPQLVVEVTVVVLLLQVVLLKVVHRLGLSQGGGQSRRGVLGDVRRSGKIVLYEKNNISFL